MKYSTKDLKTLWTYNWNEGNEQSWQRTDLGFQVPFATITGGIFEPGFTDCFMRMLAAYLAEREGKLESRLGCVTLSEVVDSHRLFEAAIKSHEQGIAIQIDNI